MAALLPEAFAALEPFAPKWAIAGANQRALQRGDSTLAERTAFYEAARAVLPQALTYLDTKPLSTLGPADRGLMNLMLSLAHVALAVENHGEADAAHALSRRRLPITRAPSDA
jgi:hypothetical protein